MDRDGAAARCLKVITKFPVEKADVERTLRLAEAFSRGCLSVDAECAHDWCVGMTTLIDRFDNDTKGHDVRLGTDVCLRRDVFAGKRDVILWLRRHQHDAVKVCETRAQM